MLKELTEVRTGIWVHAVEPTEEEIAMLGSTFSLDSDLLEDACDFFEVPRLERVGSQTYFFTRYPFTDEKEGSDTAPLLVIVGESFIITLVMRPITLFKDLISGEKIIYTTQKAKFFIQIIDLLTKKYDSELVRLRRAVHRDRIRLRKIGPKEIERLVQHETKLNSMVDALMPTNVALQQVTSGGYIQLYSDDVELMEDLIIANSQVVNSARSILKTIQNIRGSIEAIMSSRLNNVLRILTVLTILLTVPLVIASLYGMNVNLPFQESERVFWYILLFNIGILGVLMVIFRKYNWF